MGRHRYVRVLFARGVAATPIQRLIHAVIRTMSRSPIVHCAVASDGIVINPSFRGVSAHDAVDFVRHTESLAWSVKIPVAEYPDVLMWREDGRPRFRLVRCALRWASCGLHPSKDCVHTTVEILRSTGVVVPRRITTPAALLDWLRGQGYELHDIDKRPCSTRTGDWAGMHFVDPLA